MDQKHYRAPLQFNSFDGIGLSAYNFNETIENNEDVITPELLSTEQNKNSIFDAPNEFNTCQHFQNHHINFEDDSVIDDPLRKMIKQTSEYSQAASIITPTKARKDRKKSCLKSKSVISNPDAIESDGFDIEDDSYFSCMKYKSVFKNNEGYVIMELSVKNIPEFLATIDNEEARNYLKSLGDAFIGDLVAIKIIDKYQLKKDCLSSLPIWNALFDIEKRREFESKAGRIKKFFVELRDLNEQITPKRWIEYFLNFVSRFDAKMYRTSEGIQSKKRRQIYELLSHNLKKAVSILCGRLESIDFWSSSLLEFEIDKLYKSKVVFKFKIADSKDFKSIIKSLNSCIDDAPAVFSTAVNKQETMKEEKDDFHPEISIQSSTKFSNSKELEGESSLLNPIQQQQQQQESEDRIFILPPLDGLTDSLTAFFQGDSELPNNNFDNLPFHPENSWLENVVHYGSFESQLFFDL